MLWRTDLTQWHSPINSLLRGACFGHLPYNQKIQIAVVEMNYLSTTKFTKRQTEIIAETIEDTLGQDVHSFQIVRQEWLARGALPADAEISIAPGLADAEGRPTATRRTSISRTI